MNYTLSDVSLVIPSRTNLKYLKWNYASIRKNLGNDIWICYADDASTDGTWEWLRQIAAADDRVRAMRNPLMKRLGHTVLYDAIVEHLVDTPLAIISHADMYWTPNSVDNMLRLMGPKTIVSATRIEPPLHPPGPEKIVQDFGSEPEVFNENGLLEFVANQPTGKVTKGVFAPWMFNVSDFKEINGHDPLYRPQSKEDSDIWNRFLLNGVDFFQSWDSYVYHMTCRGSRYNPTLTTVGSESDEWLTQNVKSSRNFIRKWGHFVKHDEYIYPVVLPKYNVVFVVKNSNYYVLEAFEPWCDLLISDTYLPDLLQYVTNEQQNTTFDMISRVREMNMEERFGSHGTTKGNVIVSFDANLLTNDSMQFISNLSEIIQQTNEIGTFKHDIFKVTINSLDTYEKDLIVCQDDPELKDIKYIIYGKN